MQCIVNYAVCIHGCRNESAKTDVDDRCHDGDKRASLHAGDNHCRWRRRWVSSGALQITLHWLDCEAGAGWRLASSLATGATVVAEEEEEEEEETRAFRPASATAVRVRLCAAAVRPVIKSLAQTARGKRRRAALSIDFALPASPSTTITRPHPTHTPPARPAPRRSPRSGQASRERLCCT